MTVKEHDKQRKEQRIMLRVLEQHIVKSSSNVSVYLVRPNVAEREVVVAG